MKEIITYCDCCGEKTEKIHFKGSILKFEMEEWSGGSMGGSEDAEHCDIELCADCAHKIESFLKDEMKIKLQSGFLKKY